MNFDPLLYRFGKERLDPQDEKAFYRASMKIRSDILELIAQAGSGHIGGSYSTADALLLAYVCGNIFPANTQDPERDRIIVSHGHISPAVYTILADMGFIGKEDLFREYRRIPGRYEGHPSITANGVEWGNGSLGEGLSVGCGMALACRMKKSSARVFVFMGDGENDKGQITEAMALAAKYRLDSVIAFIDNNGLQCTDCVDRVLPMDLRARYEAYGWNVIEVDGHDFGELYKAFRTAYLSENGKPCVVIGKTVMGKGLPFIENDRKYHGSFLDSEGLKMARVIFSEYTESDLPVINTEIPKGKLEDSASKEVLGDVELPVYESPTACREAMGESLLHIARAWNGKELPAVIDCDVAASTGMAGYMEQYPQCSIQCGIAESNAVSVAGGLAIDGITTFFSTFAVFALGEVYGPLRTDIMNHAPVKILATHCGLDVGPDGKTHQCVDYIGLAANLFGTEMIIPADGNQTVHAMRYLSQSKEAGILAVGRSKIPVLRKEDGSLFYGKDYQFRYGEADWIRKGRDMTIVSYGTLLNTAAEAAKRLEQEGISCSVLNVSCPLALDGEKLAAAAEGPILVFEDHNVYTGLGVRVAAWLLEQGKSCRMEMLGLRQFGGSAGAEKLYATYGLDVEGLMEKAREIYREERKDV